MGEAGAGRSPPGGGQGEGRDPAGVGRHLKLCLNPSLTKIAQQYLSSIALHCLAMFKLVLFENFFVCFRVSTN